RNPTAVVIKIAEELQNLQGMSTLPLEYQEQTVHRIMRIFAPLAGQLGMDLAMNELYDGVLRIVDPDGYETASNVFAAASRLLDTEGLCGGFEHMLAEANVSARTLHQIASRYTIRRLRRGSSKRQVDPHEVTSLVIVTQSYEDCYRALGIIHSRCHPMK